MLLLFLALQDPVSIPENFKGWTKEGSWKWAKGILTATAEGGLAKSSRPVLTREPPTAAYTIEVDLQLTPTRAHNAFIFVRYKKADLAIVIDFEKDKPELVTGWAAAVDPQGPVNLVAVDRAPLDDVDFKEWLKAKVVVTESDVQVHINDKVRLTSDMAGVIGLQERNKEAYDKRIHKGIGLGIWNQDGGGPRISVQFRNFSAR